MIEEANSYDLFISYKTIDEKFAKKLAESIESQNYQNRNLRVFLYAWDIKPGENIVNCIDNGLENSRYIALILSPDYLEGDWTNAEKDASIYQDPSGRLGRVIPLMYRKCKLPPLLAYRSYIDFTDNSNFKNNLQMMLSVLKNEPLPRGKQLTNLDQNLDYYETNVQKLDSISPDNIEEYIYPNIFEVTKVPNYIWSAPTEFRERKHLIKYYRSEVVPPFLLLNKRLYGFSDLTKPNQPFLGVIEEYDIQREKWQEWIKDETKAKHLVWLLNDCVRSHARHFKLSYYKPGKKHYYKSGTLKENGFKAFSKGRGKDMIIDYPNAYGGKGYKSHRGVNIKFILIKNKPYMWIETGWVFTYDGYKPIEGKQRSVLNTRFMSNQRNYANFNEVRYWLWFLSADGKRVKFDVGNDNLEVDANPIPIRINKGIFNDQKTLSPTGKPPQLFFETDSKEEILFRNITDIFEDDNDEDKGDEGYFF